MAVSVCGAGQGKVSVLQLEDMREHGREMSKTKQSALEFLQRAGIVDASGQLAEPFRN
jgi:hypothetical protein